MDVSRWGRSGGWPARGGRRAIDLRLVNLRGNCTYRRRRYDVPRERYCRMEMPEPNRRAARTSGEHEWRARARGGGALFLLGQVAHGSSALVYHPWICRVRVFFTDKSKIISGKRVDRCGFAQANKIF